MHKNAQECPAFATARQRSPRQRKTAVPLHQEIRTRAPCIERSRTGTSPVSGRQNIGVETAKQRRRNSKTTALFSESKIRTEGEAPTPA